MSSQAPAPSGRRLDAGARRAELLAVGARHFARTAYDEVRMRDVAADAGVSRALLYRYFPAKRDLFAAVYRDAADRLLAASEIRPGGSFAELLARGLEAHLDYFEANRRTVLAANRTLSGDPVVQAIITDELDVLRTRMLDSAGLTGDARRAAAPVAAAWLVFVRVATVDWLADPAYDRDTLRSICVGALAGSFGALGLELPGDPR